MPVRRSSNHIPSPPVPDKPGIVTILGADCDRNIKAGSIRKTLSADMSSKKWLQQNGFFSPIKKIVSSQEIAMAAADHGEQELDDNPNQDDVWRSIQKSNPPQNGAWGSILTQKSDNSLLPPPYVLPPVKRSASSLSNKSLEICTESLGSETGSDCFSGNGAAEGLSDGDEDEDMQRSVGESEEVRGENPFADLHVVKYKTSPVRPFPPPLPSLRMHSHRENGRLVLEAVSVAPRNYFHVQRQHGRLVLTYPTNHEADAVGDDGCDVVEMEEEEEVEREFVVEQNLSLSTGMLVMKKLMAVGNINPKWSNKADELLQEHPIPPSLPLRLITPPASSAASFNAYEYFWRTAILINNPMAANKYKSNQDLVVMRGSKTEQFLPLPHMRGCKEARRSPFWEPYCIATS